MGKGQLSGPLCKTLSTTNQKWVGAYVGPIGILSHRNLPQWVMKVESYEEAVLNGILRKTAFKSSILTHFAHPSYAQYLLVSLS